MKSKLLIASIIALTAFTFSCNKENTFTPTVDYKVKDHEIIKQYIADNNFEADSLTSGLFYIIEDEGSSEHPSLSSTIEVHYVGKFTDGYIFDKTNSQSFSSKLSQLIEGWQQGIPLIGKGGSIKLLVPSHLGYGSIARPGIPANSVLIFDIELIDFQ